VCLFFLGLFFSLAFFFYLSFLFQLLARFGWIDDLDDNTAFIDDLNALLGIFWRDDTAALAYANIVLPAFYRTARARCCLTESGYR